MKYSVYLRSLSMFYAAALAVTILASSAIAQDDDKPLLLTFSVGGSVQEPKGQDEEPESVQLPDGRTIDIPFRHIPRRPFSTTISVIPGGTHVGRVLTDDHDLSYEVTLAELKPEGILVAVEVSYLEPSKVRAMAQTAGSNLVQVTDYTSVMTSALMQADGSTVKVAETTARIGDPPNQTVATIVIFVSMLYGDI